MALRKMKKNLSNYAIWTPDSATIANADLTRFSAWVGERYSPIKSYEDLHAWSIADIDRFWRSIWEYFDLGPPLAQGEALPDEAMPGCRWFPGQELNFAEHVLTRAPKTDPAIIAFDEELNQRVISADDFRRDVEAFAAALRDAGIKAGDVVVAMLPNIPEAIVAMLATASIGAIWSVVSPETGASGAISRFAQLEPRVLIAVDGYRFRGKLLDRRENLNDVIAGLPSLEMTVVIPQGFENIFEYPGSRIALWPAFVTRGASSGNEVGSAPCPVEFNHPLWVLYSSGTTGIPKAMVQSHGGILLEMLKNSRLHLNLREGERLFFYSVTGWMVWNLMFGALLSGATIVLYDGHPSFPEPGKLWRVAELSRTTIFGASPTYVQTLMQADYRPRDRHDLRNLRSILLSGAPVSADVMNWLLRAVSSDLWLQSACGGTDVCTSFVGGVPTLPVFAGEIQARGLGIDAVALDADGHELVNKVGELVIRKPMPSMPLFFWNDPQGIRYRDAYFDMYAGWWRQGDFVKFNERGGAFVLGRSDATMNRHGVRIGTAEIYGALESLPEVSDALIITVELPNGDLWMPLYVLLADALSLDNALKMRIRDHLRAKLSPRHVPDEVIAVESIPYNKTGKRLEVPVRRLLAGTAVAEALSSDALADKEGLAAFMKVANQSFHAASLSASKGSSGPR